MNQMAPGGPEVTFFGDGEDVRQAVARDPPDLVVLDINMPRMDGLTALRSIRAAPATRSVPAIIFSTARNEADVAAGRELRVQDFVQKPGHFDDFCKAVAGILRHAKAATGVGSSSSDLAPSGRAWSSPARRGIASRRLDLE